MSELSRNAFNTLVSILNDILLISAKDSSLARQLLSCHSREADCAEPPLSALGHIKQECLPGGWCRLVVSGCAEYVTIESVTRRYLA